MPYDVPALTFVDDAQRITDGETLVAHVPAELEGGWCALLNILAEQLQFPSYFGYNVSALWDCLCDFHWTARQKILIIHEDLPPGIPAKGLRTYLRILVDAIAEWQSDPDADHKLEVIFPPDCRTEIERLLQRDAD